MTETIPQALAAAVRRDPASPLLTWYDDASGDRTELSGATLDNWVSKTANLLVDGVGLGPEETVAVLLPPHWQTAAILLGVSASGAAIATDGGPQPVEALFTHPERAEEAAAWPAGERYVTGLLPLAMPLRTLPPGTVDYPTEVRTFGDYFNPVQPVSPDAEAFTGQSHRAVMEAAGARAAELGIGAGARVLLDTQKHPDVLDWLLAPLVAGASVVLCGNLDRSKLDARVAAEKATVVLA